MTDKEVLKIAFELCKTGNHKLLYLSRHGSYLYGTNTPESDEDFKGIYLPCLNDLLMGKKFSPLTYQTKNDLTTKNEKDDIDLQLFPIQFFLNKLVKKGETEGIELLYSHTNRDAVLYNDPDMVDLFLSKHTLFDPRMCEGFLGFAISQARTYFTKAERFKVIEKICVFLDSLRNQITEEMRLIDVIDKILADFGHPTYCFEIESNNIRSLQVCGKVHQETIKLTEFYDRIAREFHKYGHRTRRAADLNSVDWKSLSSALKAIYEVTNLLTDHALIFPLPDRQRDILLNIKLGKMPLEEVEVLIMKGIDYVDQLIPQFNGSMWGYKRDYVRDLITNLYKIHF